MFSMKSSSFLRLLAFLLLSSTLYSFSDEVSQNLHLQTIYNPDVGVTEGSGYDIVSRGTRRSVAEGSNGEAAANSSMILAAERTHRKDPLDHFKHYTGGWDISGKHYFSSVAFTGAPLFVIAAIWFLGFALCLLLLCLCRCFCPQPPYGYSRTAYELSFIFLTLFTIAAVVGSVVLYTGQGKFHVSTRKTLDHVLSRADATVQSLGNVSGYFDAAKRVQLAQVSLPVDFQNSINKVGGEINDSAATLEKETKKNKKNIDDVLRNMALPLVIVAAATLLLALLGFLFSVLGLQFLVYFLVLVGWILVAGTFILCGVFLALNNMVGDTCAAMHDWVENPMFRTSLDDVLPCVDNATAQEAVSQNKEAVLQLVGIVNGVINVSNAKIPVGLPFYNQSGPPIPTLCNPYNSDKSDRICAPGEVDFGNATQVWKNYECDVSSNKTCTGVGRLTPIMYEQMTNTVNVIHGLYQSSPFLAGLANCSFVRETFTDVIQSYCDDLLKYSRWIYIG
ncbi:hypothetical protein NMG60_11002772 [Bertholletia excelsa]